MTSCLLLYWSVYIFLVNLLKIRIICLFITVLYYFIRGYKKFILNSKFYVELSITIWNLYLKVMAAELTDVSFLKMWGFPNVGCGTLALKRHTLKRLSFVWFLCYSSTSFYFQFKPDDNYFISYLMHSQTHQEVHNPYKAVVRTTCHLRFDRMSSRGDIRGNITHFHSSNM